MLVKKQKFSIFQNLFYLRNICYKHQIDYIIQITRFVQKRQSFEIPAIKIHLTLSSSRNLSYRDFTYKICSENLWFPKCHESFIESKNFPLIQGVVAYFQKKKREKNSRTVRILGKFVRISSAHGNSLVCFFKIL